MHGMRLSADIDHVIELDSSNGPKHACDWVQIVRLVIVVHIVHVGREERGRAEQCMHKDREMGANTGHAVR